MQRHGTSRPVLLLARATAHLQAAWRDRRARRVATATKLQAGEAIEAGDGAPTADEAARESGACLVLQCWWRSRGAVRELQSRRKAAADALKERKRTARRERLAEKRAYGPYGPYTVPAAPPPRSRHRCAEAATRVQAAWRRCLGRRIAHDARLAKSCAADAHLAMRYAAREVDAAAIEALVQRNVATVRAFRQLEADLRVQGIRVASGAASGGRQRAAARKRRQREGIVERLWQQTMGR